MSFMNKSLTHVYMITHAYMIMSQLRNKHLQSRYASNRLAFSKQCNYKKRKCIKKQKNKGDYYANLNEKNVLAKNYFWKTLKPLISDKIKYSIIVYIDLFN